MSYVDGFVIVIPKKNIEAYKKMAEDGSALWKKYGALDYKECLADDLNPNMGGVATRSFPQLVQLGEDETIIFSYIVYRDRAHRDEVNKKIMADESMNPDMLMPFDMKKFSYGGFETIVEW